MAKQEELSEGLLKEAINEDAKLWIDNAKPDLNKALGLENAKITMRGNAIKHVLDRHGENSKLVKKSGQMPISYEEIKKHSEIINNADLQGVSIAKNGQKVLISGKQINGYYIVIESISTKNNELKLKTMYKENGKLENNKAIREVKRLLSSNNEPSILQTQRQGINLELFIS